MDSRLAVSNYFRVIFIFEARHSAGFVFELFVQQALEFGVGKRTEVV
jgi:hypothetical protein